MVKKLAISEIIAELGNMGKPEEKIEWLLKNDSQPLREILRLTYDKSVKWLLPESPPPWKENEYEDEARLMLYREMRRMKIFLEGGGYDNLNQVKREGLFISLLEDIYNEDAKLLANYVIAQKSFKGLRKSTVVKAFPDLIKE
ncbi:MAG: hypothetical protein HOM88_05255 [Hellea sp.]|jgi:hypothetical protein|nr:hypothetical protein [Hellea sp.]